MNKILAFLLSIISFSFSAQIENATGHELAGNLLAYPYVEVAPPPLTPGMICAIIILQK